MDGMPGSPQIRRVRVDRALSPAVAMAQARQGGQSGYVDMRPLDPSVFRPVVAVPAGDYWIEDVDLGSDLLNVAPAQARQRLEAAGRSPLTLAEGIAVLLAYPGILRAANCFQMLGSSAGDKRVASLWVPREGRPRLGWCWDGNPHTWLGAASCRDRIAAA